MCGVGFEVAGRKVCVRPFQSHKSARNSTNIDQLKRHLSLSEILLKLMFCYNDEPNSASFNLANLLRELIKHHGYIFVYWDEVTEVAEGVPFQKLPCSLESDHVANCPPRVPWDN